MTKSDLKYHVTEAGSLYFTRKSMNFFGDTMANYGVRTAVVEVNDPVPGPFPGVEIKISKEVWELYRKHAVKHGLKTSAYFDKMTFKRVHV